MSRRMILPVTITALLVMVFPAAIDAQSDNHLLAPNGVPGETIYVPFPVEIELDGDLSDWAGVPLITVHKGTMISPDPAENGSLTFAVAADSEYLYISVVIQYIRYSTDMIISYRYGK